MSTLRSLKLQGTARSQLVPLDLCRGPIRTVTRRFGRTVARAPGHSHEYAKLPEWAKWGFVDEIGQVTVERSAYPCHPLQLKALRTSQSSRPGVPDMPRPPHPHVQFPSPCSPQLLAPTLLFPLRPTDLNRARLSNPEPVLQPRKTTAMKRVAEGDEEFKDERYWPGMLDLELRRFSGTRTACGNLAVASLSSRHKHRSMSGNSGSRPHLPAGAIWQICWGWVGVGTSDEEFDSDGGETCSEGRGTAYFYPDHVDRKRKAKAAVACEWATGRSDLCRDCSAGAAKCDCAG